MNADDGSGGLLSDLLCLLCTQKTGSWKLGSNSMETGSGKLGSNETKREDQGNSKATTEIERERERIRCSISRTCEAGEDGVFMRVGRSWSDGGMNLDRSKITGALWTWSVMDRNSRDYSVKLTTLSISKPASISPQSATRSSAARAPHASPRLASPCHITVSLGSSRTTQQP
jgi:hypothetical protein